MRTNTRNSAFPRALMLNCSASLAMSTSVLKALSGKLDIKRRSPSILYIWTSLAMSTSVLKALPGKLDIKRHSSPSILHASWLGHRDFNCGYKLFLYEVHEKLLKSTYIHLLVRRLSFSSAYTLITLMTKVNK